MSYLTSNNTQLHNGRQPWSYTVADDIMRFEVRSGDQWIGDSDVKERSEIRDLNRMAFGTSYTVEFSFMVEPGAKNTAGWLMIAQLHATEDAADKGVSPIFNIKLRGEKMALEVRSLADATTTTEPPSKTIYLDTANIERGHWYDMKLEITVDPFGAGSVDAWRDGVKIADYDGAIGYNDLRGPYWKMGVYRSEASESFAVNFKDFELGKTPEVVDPMPNNPPASHGVSPWTMGYASYFDTLSFQAQHDSADYWL